jgi:PAS domain S-box-containing protein
MLCMQAFAPRAAASVARTVRVGVYQNEPKIFTDQTGRPAGIFLDLLEAMAAQEDWNLVYVSCEWADCLDLLENGQIDLLPDMAYSPERDALYDFHSRSVLESWSALYAAPRTTLNNLAQLDGKRVAVLNGSIQQTVFAQMVSGFGLQVTIVPADSLVQAFELATAGQADAAIANHFFGDYFYQKYGLAKTTIIFNPVSLYYATTAGRNPELLAAIDRHLDQWRQEPNSVYYTTLSRWGAPQPAASLPAYFFWALGGSVGLLVFAVGLILLLRQQVRVRTRKLEQTNVELHASEARYRTLARISPVGIFRTDPRGATTYVNPKWCEIAGLPADQALGHGWLAAVHPDDREAISQDWQASAQHQQPAYSDYRFVRPDGTTAWVMGQAVPELDAGGQFIGYVGTITDITERVRAESELRGLNTELEARVAQRTEELSAAMYQAQEADRLKSTFLATMSHELRTPLNSIIGFTGVLLQGLAGPLNAEQTKQMSMVRDSARHLLALINDVLDISKIEAGQLRLERYSFEMPAALEAALNSVLPQAQKKGLALSASIAPQVGTVVSDRRRVEQVLLNLLSNAIKFTEQGEVQLICRVQGGWLETSVRDTGSGIRPDDLGKLFQPFKQLETGLNRRHEGTGLGLAICKHLVGLLGGQIRVESVWGQGSTFTFTLPLPVEGAPHGEHLDH